MAQQDAEEGLEDVIDQLAETGDQKDQVSVGEIQGAIGRRSFGPFLLVPAIIEVSPIGGIPGLPTVLAIMVILFAAELLFGKQHFILAAEGHQESLAPRRQAEEGARICEAGGAMDRQGNPTQVYLGDQEALHPYRRRTVHPARMHGSAAGSGALRQYCPFGTIGLFGLALMARDGLLVLIGFALALGAFYVVYASLSG